VNWDTKRKSTFTDFEVGFRLCVLPFSPLLPSLFAGYGSTARLAAALPECRVLQVLDLTANNVKEEGARLLAEALPRAVALRELTLGSNAVGDSKAEKLAAALGQFSSLVRLNLSDNAIC
jgi:hypothetical protein